MLYPKFALIINSDAPVGIVTDPVPVTDVLPMRFHVKLLFTEVVIFGRLRLKAKINQSKRAWCKSHALNLFI